MVDPSLRVLGVVALSTFVGVGLALGGELVVVDQSAEGWDGEGAVRVELRDPEELRKILLKWREKDPYSCPREGLSGADRRAAVGEAKDLLRRNWEKYAVDVKLDPPPLDGLTAIREAQKQCGRVLAALGSVDDAAWVLSEPNPGWVGVGVVVAQIYARHGMGFADLEDQDDENARNWVIAAAMAKQKDKAALEWMVNAPPSIIKGNSVTDVLVPLVLNRHPSATTIAKEAIDGYLAERGEGKSPGDYSGYATALPWALLQIHIDPGAADYQARIEGMAISEKGCGEILWAAVTDPRPLIEMVFGVKGELTDYEKWEVEAARWPTAKLRAGIAGRSSEDSQELIEFYKASGLRSGLIDDWGHHEDIVAHLVNQIVTMNMSAGIPSEYAANLVNTYSDTVDTNDRFRNTPWIRMSWWPELLVPMIGKENTFTISLDRLATFPHEMLVEKLAEQTENSKLIQDSFLLYHKVLTPAFEVPLRVALGGIHSPAVKLEGDFWKVGVQSHVQMVAQRKGEELTVGFRITSAHYDDGGLASAMNRFHERLAVIHEDFGRSMIGEVRWDGVAGATGTLEFLQTTAGGVHVFKGTIPGGKVNDVYLRYEWTPPSSSYVLSHPLYEPWFALK